MTEPDDFLKRWSRRKRAAAVAPALPDTPALERQRDGETDDSRAADAGIAGTKAEPVFDVSKLPSLDSIGPATDMRIFLQPGVPAALSRAALRRAWSSDPGIRDFIGLSENSWDFTAPNSMMGFGPIEPADAQRMFAELLKSFESGNPAEAASVELPTETTEVVSASEPAAADSTALVGASDADAAADVHPAPDGETDNAGLLQSNNSAGISAALHKKEAGEELRPVSPRRAHGGALPD
jgi:hypothetical protein